MSCTRIDNRFARLRAQRRPGLVTFITAGDPDFSTSLALLSALPAAGADMIELGMPFSDPMAEGPPIQASSQRALMGGQTMHKTLDMVRQFRTKDDDTPIILMGYYNPIYRYGNTRFLDAAEEAGVDGLIVVDLPPEADEELCIPSLARGLSFIRLAAPTTDDARLPAVLANTSGFVYYVSITGVTGAAAPDNSAVAGAVGRIRAHTDLPIAVGFGVKTAAQVQEIGEIAEAVVVGSALVERVGASLDEAGRATDETVNGVCALVGDLAAGARSVHRLDA